MVPFCPLDVAPILLAFVTLRECPHEKWQIPGSQRVKQRSMPVVQQLKLGHGSIDGYRIVV